MKPIKISIATPVQECYLYSGNLFLVVKDGTLRTISIEKIIGKLYSSGTKSYKFLQLAFLQNNWFSNEQAKSIFSIDGLKEKMSEAWGGYTDSDDIGTIELSISDLDFLTDLPTMPIFEMRLYGMRLFIGNRDGLYECGININPKDGAVSLIDKLERVFDARTININAKSGSLLISSNSDGLFHGKLITINDRLNVLEKPIKNISLRASWSGYDVMNYESQSHFDYLVSEYEKTDERQYRFSGYDDESKKISIVSIGDVEYGMEQIMYQHLNILQNISFAFNSSRTCYFFLNDGSFVNININKSMKDGNDFYRLNSRITQLHSPNHASGSVNPISGNVISDGCVIEYANSVYLIKHGKGIRLEEKPVVSVRTYPNSIRYKNVISIVNRDGINLYASFPFNLFF